MKRSKPAYTTDLSQFQVHPKNRDYKPNTKRHRELFARMKRLGYDSAYPLKCSQGSDGKFMIHVGHHRFRFAAELRIGVWYVVVPAEELAIAGANELASEELTAEPWTLRDFVRSFAAGGNPEYIYLESFAKQYRLPIGIAASLLYGWAPAGGSIGQLLQRGTWVSRDRKFAVMLAELAADCAAQGVSFARNRFFLHALVNMVRLQGRFRVDHFRQQVRRYPRMMSLRACTDDFLDEIEIVYNYNTNKTKKCPLASLVRQAVAEEKNRA